MIALKETECCALAGTDYRPLLLRRRAGRPQLKRDPLGGDMMRVLVPLVLFATISTSSCRTPIDCTANIQPGIVVTIRDSATGEPRAQQAVGVVQQGGFTDQLVPYGYEGQPPVMVSRHAADERAGTYTVTIREVGYRAWERSGVRVDGGQCHVLTMTVDARLQVAP